MPENQYESADPHISTGGPDQQLECLFNKDSLLQQADISRLPVARLIACNFWQMPSQAHGKICIHQQTIFCLHPAAWLISSRGYHAIAAIAPGADTAETLGSRWLYQQHPSRPLTAETHAQVSPPPGIYSQHRGCLQSCSESNSQTIAC